MMNQNYEAGSEIFFEPPVKKDAKYYRAFAKEKLKGSAAALAGLPVLAVLVILAVMVGLAIGLANLSIAVESQTVRVILWSAFGLLFYAVMSLVFIPSIICVQRGVVRAINGERVRFAELLGSMRQCNGADYAVGLIGMAVIFAATALGVVGVGLLGAFAWSGDFNLLGIAVLLWIVSLAAVIFFSIRFSFVFAIRAEYPELSAWDSFRNAYALSRSNVKKTTGVSNAFGGWYLLAILITVLTAGLGVVALCVVAVYDTTAQTDLYYDLSQHNKADEVEFPSLDPDDYDPNEARW